MAKNTIFMADMHFFVLVELGSYYHRLNVKLVLFIGQI